jgi:uncharacterized protein (DUF4415 family)
MKKSFTQAQMEQLAYLMASLMAVNDEPVQGIEFTDAELDFDMKLDIDINPDIVFSASPPLPSTSGTSLVKAPCTGTRKISIRVSNAVLNAFREQAKRKGTKPQTLINRVLMEQSKGW